MSVSIRERLAAVRLEIQNGEATVTALQASIAAAQASAQQLRAEADQLILRLGAANASVNAAQARVTAAALAVNRAQAEVRRIAVLLARNEGSAALEAQLEAAQDAFIQAQQARDSEAATLTSLQAQLAAVNQNLSATQQQAAAAGQQVANLTAQLNDVQTKLTDARQRLILLQAEQARIDELNAALGAMPAADVPIAMLPVRIETRFLPAGADFDFCVRVFPDDIHVESHEPELLPHEVLFGRNYHEQIWRAATQIPRRKAAWAQLAEQLGPERAAWVIRATKPTNPQDKPAQPVADDQLLPKPLIFADPPTHAESWTRPPMVRTMPDRWVFAGYREGQRSLLTWGQPVPSELAAGPDPAAPPQNVPDDQLPYDPGMKWLVDFDEAVRIGMGIRVRLTAAEAARGYDELVVIGLKASVNAATGAARLGSMLDAQHYTDGLAFVPQGTPTNNTPAGSAGFRSKDPGFENSFAAEVTGGDTAQRAGDNATTAARALGIDVATFSSVAGADGAEQTDARDMNIALWPATWGYFLDQMMGDTLPSDRLATVRKLFIDHVRGQGTVPVLRVGRQPYGILPASSLDRWKPDGGDATRIALVKVLRELRSRWRTALAGIPRVGRATTSTSAADNDLLQMLAIEPVSTGFQARPVVDGAFFGTPAIPQILNALPSDVADRRQGVLAAVAKLGSAWQPRLLQTVFLGDAFALVRSLVQPGGVDDVARLAPNYIDWLRTSDFATIVNEVYPGTFGPAGTKLDSLLYMLLRHSVLLAYADVAHRILSSENIVTAAKRPEPALSGILDPAGETGLSEMEKTPPSLGGAKISVRINTLGAANNPAALELDELRGSLSRLAVKATADLERLLPQTLDCASHRLDAWVTSLPSERVAKLRQTKPVGVLLGGYGWLQNIKPDTSRQPVPLPAGETGRMVMDSDSGGFVHAPSLNQAATSAILRAGFLANRNSGPNQPFAIDLSSERVRRAQFLLDGVREGQPLTALLGYRFERGLHEGHPGIELDKFIEAFRKLAPLGEIYAARADKDDAKSQADTAAASAAAKRQQAGTMTAQPNARLAQLQEARAEAASDLSAAQAEAASLREEIRRLLLGGGGQSPLRAPAGGRKDAGGPVPSRIPTDAGTAELLAELRAELSAAQARATALTARIATLDPQIAAAAQAAAAANAQAQQLLAEALALDGVVTTQRARQTAAAAREKELLDRERANRLLPPDADSTALEGIAAQNVVDGLALHKRYRKAIDAVPGPVWNRDSVPFGELGLPPISSVEAQAIIAELRDLDDCIDAVSDAVTAEAVHHSVLGNPMRAGATLEAVAGGETPPPELDFVRTPRTGTAITHRLAILLPEAAATSTWPVDGMQTRALAEPRLNAWAASILGDPKRIRYRAEYVVNGAGSGLKEFTFDGLRMSPLDLLCMAEAGERAAEGPLEQRIRYSLLRGRPSGTPANAAVRLDFSRAANWGADVLSVPEAVIFARSAAQLISSARSLDSRDLDVAESGAATAFDVADLGARVDRLVTAFTNAHTRLKTLTATPAGAATEDLRTAMLSLSFFDIDSVPVSAAGDTPADKQNLLNQAGALLIETTKRFARLQVLNSANVSGMSPADRLERERERTAIVLGKSFRIVPRFQPPNAAVLNQSLADSGALLAGDRLAPLTWLQRIARVRAGSSRLNDVLTTAQCVTPAMAEPGLRVAQLPFRAGDRWTALPLDSNRTRPQATLSVVLHVPQGFAGALSANVAGLMIDEWVDTIPNAAEQTGLAFHFDAPASRPPQAILLATSPGDQPNWDLETLESIVIETMEMARLRMVEPTRLDDQVTHFLPAMYFGLNLAGETVSTDFQRAATAAQA